MEDIYDYPEHAITEWKLDTKYNEVNTYIYGLYQKNNNKMIPFNIMKYFSKTLYDYYESKPIGIFGSFIISWSQLEKYEDNKYKMLDHNINDKKFDYIKKILTERLYIETIKFNEIRNVNIKWNKIKNDSLISEKKININKFKDIDIYEKLKISCKINDNNDIFIGFYLTYMLLSKNNINEKTLYNNKDIKLINMKDFSKVILNKKTNFKLNDKIIEKEKENSKIFLSLKEYLGEYIIQKYDINEKSIILSVNYNNNFVKSVKEYYVPIEMLKLDYSNYRNNNLFKNELKKHTNDKIIMSYKYMKEILININKNEYLNQYYNFSNDGINMKNHGFNFNLLNKPIINKNYNLLNKRDYLKGNNEYIKTSKWNTNYLNPIFIIYKCKKYDEKIINNFINDIFNQSKLHKVTMHFKEINGKKYIEKDYITEQFIESIKNSLVIILIDSYTYDNEYDYLKNKLSEYNIPNQIIKKKTLEINDTPDKMKKVTTNILFGILFKCGIYIKKINNNMNNKCFVGMDVSHYIKLVNDKKIFIHSISCTIIIFDKNNNMYITEIGEEVKEKNYIEKIYPKTVKKIFNNIINEYKDICNIEPKHITIHRDGFCRSDEFNSIKEILNEYNIKFSLLEVFKKINRNMGKYNGNNYETIVGTYISYKYNEAFMITTKPYGNQASAFKINLKYNNFDIDFNVLLTELYWLTFLAFHFDSINDKIKIRLPITIYYSDKSSTSHSKGHLNYGIHYRILNP